MESKQSIENDKTEFILYEEKTKDNEERIENSQSDIEMITDEEYLLDCARYGEIEDLRNLFEEVKDLNINYQDSKQNSALRKYNLIIRHGCSKWAFRYSQIINRKI
jgi:hypothetical protein